MSDTAEIRKRRIYRVTFIGFVVNLVLSLLKLAAGILGRSGAMIADAPCIRSPIWPPMSS